MVIIDTVILMDNTQKMPSMGWNALHKTNLKTTKINISGLHFGIVS